METAEFALQFVFRQYAIYQGLIVSWWSRITPGQYLAVLGFILLGGWLLMKNNLRR